MSEAHFTLILALWLGLHGTGLVALWMTLRPVLRTREARWHLCALVGFAVVLLALSYLVPLVVHRSGGEMLIEPGSSAPGKELVGQALVRLWAGVLRVEHPAPWFVVHVLRAQILLSPFLAYALAWVAIGGDRSPQPSVPSSAPAEMGATAGCGGPARLSMAFLVALALLLFDLFTIGGSLFAGYYSFIGNLTCLLLVGAHRWAAGPHRLLGLALFCVAALLMGFARPEGLVPVGVMLGWLGLDALRRRRNAQVALLFGSMAILAVFSVVAVRLVLHKARIDPQVLGTRTLGDDPIYTLPLLALKNVLLNLPRNLLGLLLWCHWFFILAALRVWSGWRLRQLILPERALLLWVGMTVALVLGHRSGFWDPGKYPTLLAVPLWYLSVRRLAEQSAPAPRHVRFLWRLALGWSALILVVNFVGMATSPLPRQAERLYRYATPAVVQALQHHEEDPSSLLRSRNCLVHLVLCETMSRELRREVQEYVCAAVGRMVSRRCRCATTVTGLGQRSPRNTQGEAPLCALPDPVARPPGAPMRVSATVLFWGRQRDPDRPLSPSLTTSCGWRVSLSTRDVAVLIPGANMGAAP